MHAPFSDNSVEMAEKGRLKSGKIENVSDQVLQILCIELDKIL